MHALLSFKRTAAGPPSSPDGSPSPSDSGRIGYGFLLETVQWYSDELCSPSTADYGLRHRASSFGSPYEAEAAAPSTAYYYGADGGGFGGGATPSRGAEDPFGRPSSSGSGGGAPPPAAGTRKELGEFDSLALHSILDLMGRVALTSPAARDEILSVRLPVVTDGVTAEEGDALTVLFSLILQPIPSDLRGAAFVAVANLIRGGGSVDDGGDRSQRSSSPLLSPGEVADGGVGIARRGWELLEASQILPVGLLAQFAPFTGGGGGVTATAMGGDAESSPWAGSYMMAGPPPGLIARVPLTGGGGGLSAGVLSSDEAAASSSAWFPASEKYGILHEAERVESAAGRYPSTEGFLYLLSALTTVGGCPPDLGSASRPRPGCAPYVEYVTHFVLPRVLGTGLDDGKGLPFATAGDKQRLISRALEVVDTMIGRYIVPLPPPSPIATSASSSALAGSGFDHSPLGRSVAKHQTGSMDILSAMSPEEVVTEHERTVRATCEGLGLSPTISMLFPPVGALRFFQPDDIADYARDFCNDEVIGVAADSTPYPGALGTPLTGRTSYFESNGQQGQTFGLTHQSSAIVGPPSHSAVARPLTAPRAKSPGFSILSDVLSADGGGSLFRALARILTEGRGAGGVDMYGQAAYSRAVALALFGDAPPDYSSMKAWQETKKLSMSGIAGTGITSLGHSSAHSESPRAMMMLPLLPPAVHATFDIWGKCGMLIAPDDAAAWRERSVLLCLRILCAAGVREEAFLRAVQARWTSLTVVPVLRFGGERRRAMTIPGALEVRDIRVTRLTELLITAAGRSAFPTELIPAIAEFVGYQPLALCENGAVAKAAMSLITFVVRTVPHRESLPALCGRTVNGGRRLAEALAGKLLLPPTGGEAGVVPEKEDLRHVIVDMILSGLGLNSVGDNGSLSLVLLGLSDISIRQAHKVTATEVSIGRNCLDAVLHLLSDAAFVLDPCTSSLASKCFELIYRLCVLESSWVVKIYVKRKLRTRGFWNTNILRFLGGSELIPSTLHSVATRASENGSKVDFDVLHSISWLLKGVAVELSSLMSVLKHDISPAHVELRALMAAQPTQCQRILAILFSSPRSIMLATLMALPLSTPSVTAHLHSNAPSPELVKFASKVMNGPSDVFGGHRTIDHHVLIGHLRSLHRGKSHVGHTSAGPIHLGTEREEAAIAWAKTWNTYASYSCASSHISAAWGMLLRSSVLCCQSLLFPDDTMLPSKFATDVVIEREALVTLLTTALSRLIDQKLLKGGCQINKNNDGLEPGSSLPLSSAVLQLMNVLIYQNGMAQTNGTHTFMHGEESKIIIELLVLAIASCSKDFGNSQVDKRAAILSCALAMFLENVEDAKPTNFLSSPEFGEENQSLNAAVHLSNLAFQTGTEDGSSVNKSSPIALAARSGLTAIIAHFDVCESEQQDYHTPFVVQLFGSEHGDAAAGSGRLPNLVRLLTKYDDDIPYTLERIACCNHGTEILLNAGVMNALIVAAEKYSNDVFGLDRGIFKRVEQDQV